MIINDILLLEEKMRMNLNRLILLKSWPKQVKSVLIHIISMARIAMLYARSRCLKNKSGLIAGQLEQAKDEINLLREELRIKDARLNRISPNHRPHYTPTERLAILELKAARGWSDIQAAEVFMVCPDTIAFWTKMLDDIGPKSLLRITEPVNKLPDFIKYIVGRLKVLCPAMGKVRIAQALAKAGLVLSASTVGRMLKKDIPPKKPDGFVAQVQKSTIRALYPNHAWNIDLTIIPTTGGFWISWLPNAIRQVWPFCWWLACILDQYSRCVIGFAVFEKQPTAKQLRDFLKRAVHKGNCIPKHIITDKGTQFKSKTFRKWCKRKHIGLRYGTVGRYGSIAIIERFFRTLKKEWLRKIIIPLDTNGVRNKLTMYIRWYNFFRPHQGLDGASPADIYTSKPQKADTLTLRPDDKIELLVSFHEGDKLLPIIRLRKAS
jgi:transposase InsO family protein